MDETDRTLDGNAVAGMLAEVFAVGATTATVRCAESRSRAGASLPAARRWRSIDISGTSPEPPATSRSGPPSRASQVNQPPMGPRSSSSSPSRTTSAR